MSVIQERLAVVFFVLLIIETTISLYFILANGGSLFEDDPKCLNCFDLTKKYAPKSWVVFNRWFFGVFFCALGILAVIVLFTSKSN